MIVLKKTDDIKCKEKWRLGKKFKSQVGFEPTTLCDLVGCSNHWATGDSMVSKGQFVGLYWNCMVQQPEWK